MRYISVANLILQYTHKKFDKKDQRAVKRRKFEDFDCAYAVNNVEILTERY